jgi:hypothetical protein
MEGLSKDDWRLVLRELSVPELLCSRELSSMHAKLVEEEEFVWRRHKERVLKWCPRLSLFFENNASWKAFMLFFKPLTETVMNYLDAGKTDLALALVYSVYSLQVPLSYLTTEILPIPNKFVLFQFTLHTKPEFEDMSITFWLQREDAFISKAIRFDQLVMLNDQPDDEPFMSLVIGENLDKLYYPRVLAMPESFLSVLEKNYNYRYPSRRRGVPLLIR